jgi:hypothetical protein
VFSCHTSLKEWGNYMRRNTSDQYKRSSCYFCSVTGAHYGLLSVVITHISRYYQSLPELDLDNEHGSRSVFPVTIETRIQSKTSTKGKKVHEYQRKKSDVIDPNLQSVAFSSSPADLYEEKHTVISFDLFTRFIGAFDEGHNCVTCQNGFVFTFHRKIILV